MAEKNECEGHLFQTSRPVWQLKSRNDSRFVTALCGHQHDSNQEPCQHQIKYRHDIATGIWHQVIVKEHTCGKHLSVLAPKGETDTNYTAAHLANLIQPIILTKKRKDQTASIEAHLNHYVYQTPCPSSKMKAARAVVKDRTGGQASDAASIPALVEGLLGKGHQAEWLSKTGRELYEIMKDQRQEELKQLQRQQRANQEETTLWNEERHCVDFAYLKDDEKKYMYAFYRHPNPKLQLSCRLDNLQKRTEDAECDSDCCSNGGITTNPESSGDLPRENSREATTLELGLSRYRSEVSLALDKEDETPFFFFVFVFVLVPNPSV
mmetsp:Transcript_31519/g.49352  ORF Transcript_31519/g.49352 Transcript_31519/m.49352 type:complete len:323 (+) Transcript_31519:869-1837(+)